MRLFDTCLFAFLCLVVLGCSIPSVVGALSEDKPAEADEILSTFEAWLIEHGANMDGALVEWVGDGMRYGVVATHDLPSGHQVFSVPINLFIHFQHALRGDMGKVYETNEWITELDGLGVFVMHQRLKGDSFWKPWLDMWPESIDTPLLFSEEELGELQASTLKAYVLENKKNLLTRFEQWTGIDYFVDDFGDSFTEENFLSEYCGFACIFVFVFFHSEAG